MAAQTAKRKSRTLVPALIILGGFILMLALIASRKKPESNVPEFAGVLVETLKVSPSTHRATITGAGTVRAKNEVAFAPQVGGKVEWVSEEFASGGSFRTGDVLFRVEAIDFELAVEQAKARVAQAEYQLSVEQAQADVAKREWGRMSETNTNLSDAPASLVLREPQLKQAEANLASALAAFRQAELALDRSKVRAPFNGRVRRESVNIGQMVAPGVPVGMLYSTGVAEIEVGLPVDEQMWLEIPGSTAIVKLSVAGDEYSWQGKVVRWVGALDSIGRLSRVVIEVNDPYTKREDGGPALAVGSFVNVEISGREIENAVAVPRTAIHSGDIIWIVTADNTLELRPVTIALRTREEVYITDGLNVGERVVLTPISGAADGLKLRIAEGGSRG